MEEKLVEVNTLKSKIEKFKESLDKWKEDISNNFAYSTILPPWQNHNAVSEFRSVRRAIRRGKVDLYTGSIFPDRPFSNKKDTRGRKVNKMKRELYEQYKGVVQ